MVKECTTVSCPDEEEANLPVDDLNTFMCDVIRKQMFRTHSYDAVYNVYVHLDEVSPSEGTNFRFIRRVTARSIYGVAEALSADNGWDAVRIEGADPISLQLNWVITFERTATQPDQPDEIIAEYYVSAPLSISIGLRRTSE